MKRYCKSLSYAIVSIFLIVGCGGGGGDRELQAPPNKKSNEKIAYYIDTRVEGIEYKCKEDDQIKLTDKFGTMRCPYSFKQVIYMTGGVEVVAPLNHEINYITESDPIKQQLLQSLDKDQNLSNGIAITKDVREYISQNNIEIKDSDDVEVLVNNLNSDLNTNFTYVKKSDAQANFYGSMQALVNDVVMGKDFYMVRNDEDKGWVVDFKEFRIKYESGIRKLYEKTLQDLYGDKVPAIVYDLYLGSYYGPTISGVNQNDPNDSYGWEIDGLNSNEDIILLPEISDIKAKIDNSKEDKLHIAYLVKSENRAKNLLQKLKNTQSKLEKFFQSKAIKTLNIIQKIKDSTTNKKEVVAIDIDLENKKAKISISNGSKKEFNVKVEDKKIVLTNPNNSDKIIIFDIIQDDNTKYYATSYINLNSIGYLSLELVELF